MVTCKRYEPCAPQEGTRRSRGIAPILNPRGRSRRCTLRRTLDVPRVCPNGLEKKKTPAATLSHPGPLSATQTQQPTSCIARARSEPGGTRWRTGGEVKGNWWMEWVASTLTPPPNVVYPALLKLMRTPRLSAVDWTDAPTDLNGLVHFGERRNMVSARVPSRSARAIPLQHCHGVTFTDTQHCSMWRRVS